jgi:hypothetical protein
MNENDLRYLEEAITQYIDEPFSGALRDALGLRIKK